MSRVIEPNRTQQFLLAPSLEDWIGPDHPARFVESFVALLDLKELGIETPKAERGEPAWGPHLMLNIWLYGWMTQVRSCRKLERACHDVIPFMWLTGNQRPDHNAIWRFWKAHHTALPKLFKKLVRISADQGLIGFALHALDGTKMQAASSTSTAFHRKRLEEMLKRLDTLIAEQVAAMQANEAQDTGDVALPERLRDEQVRREEIKRALARLDEIDRDHLHPNESDARMMKNRDGTAIGYNAQALVDEKSGMVIATNVVNAETDYHLLVDGALEGRDNTGRDAAIIVADAGYCSGRQLHLAGHHNLPVIVATGAPHDDGELGKSKFKYDADKNVYVCPRGTELAYAGQKVAKERGYVVDTYRCSNKECPVRDQCSSDKRGRLIRRSPYDDALQHNAERVKLQENKDAQRRRGSTAERLFGQTKWNVGFRRFTVRGLIKVNAQWALAMIAHNLRKLLPQWRSGLLTLAAG